MFVLPKLPYAYDALEPVISARTMKFHHDKHHATYVKTLNELLEKSTAKADNLEDVIQRAHSAGDTKLFNNAAQAWNHAFFWEAMTPTQAASGGELAAAIAKTFGGQAALKSEMVTKGVGQFGSGWVWLTTDESGNLKVVATHDAANPLAEGRDTPLLVCDVWEHAYYLDHQNDRKAFLEGWFDALPNWAFAAAQYDAARSSGRAWRYPAAAPAQPAPAVQ